MVGKAGFAFGFLIFMIPFGESLVPALQSASATSVAFLLNATGFQTTLDGLILTTAAGRFEMAESCAGLRFLLAAAMIASLAAHLAFAGLPRKLLFVAAALLLAVGANCERYADRYGARACCVRLGPLWRPDSGAPAHCAPFCRPGVRTGAGGGVCEIRQVRGRIE
jgi:hypothetical protein